MAKPGNYKKTRLKFSKGKVLLSALVFGALLGALGNLISAFATKKVYTIAPSGTVALKDFEFSINYASKLDLGQILNYALTGVVFGVVAGLVLAIFAWIFRACAEKRRNKAAEDVRASLEPVRHIVTDGYAIAAKKIPAAGADAKKKGTLILTNTTLEFYNINYTKADKNFLIKLSDVISVRAKTCLLANNKIIVNTSRASYTFRVPIGTAKKWKKRIANEVAASYGKKA